MNNYEFNVNLYGKMKVTVVAENEEEARRILDETIEGITVKDIRDKLSKCSEVTIKESSVVKGINTRNREVER